MSCNCEERIKKELPDIQPSGGYDCIDEVLGLLRVARSGEQLAEKTYLRLQKIIGKPHEGSHHSEWMPRAETWHQERLNWIKEVEMLREHIKKIDPGFKITPL